VFFIDKPLDNFEYKLELGTSTKDVYLLFTNPELIKATISPAVIRKNILNPNSNTRTASVQGDINAIQNFTNIIPQEIREFNENPPKLIKKSDIDSSQNISPSSLVTVIPDTVGDTKIFDDGQGHQVNATCKKVVTANNKTLNIWVADDSFGAGCEKIECVTQNMVDIAADKFLKVGNNNDIYEYVTNVIGEEWETTPYNELIPDTDEITILFFDINYDNTNTGGTVGYFWAKDNFKKTSVSSSNERIMFYMDSVMYASKDGGSWDITDYWPSSVISTLAHEFQHMIHFYQKGIKQDISSDAWFNEMCSMAIEDMLSDKMNVKGPRGVDPSDATGGDTNNWLGRLPRFNEKNYISLVDWNSNNSPFPAVLYDYSASYSFGAFLTRNYGGTALLKEMVQNNQANTDAVVLAVNSVNGTSKTFSDLLREWGVAVFLSDNDTDDSSTVKYEYNIDNYFTSTINSLNYNLGSINMYNYSTPPTIYTDTDNLSGDIGKYETSNLYYHVGDNLSGDVKLSITLDPKTEVTVIVK